ncbi:MAG TPA: CRTAC1 family protein [Pirellulales bacterium]|nr:CRTAC1 family protein [Pirellulales bacterium]
MPNHTNQLARLALLALLAIPALAYVILHPHYAVPPRGAGFVDRAPEAGIDFRMRFLPDEQGEKFKINLYDHGCGVLAADYDGDGRDDLLFLNQLGPNALFRNRGDGTFQNVTSENPCLALADRICVGGAFGDYDNDGDQDLYVTSTRGGNVLFENQGGGRFEDVTEAAGAACLAHSQSAAFFDYDNDGLLDLFVTNTARWTSDEYDHITKHYLGPAFLWENVDPSRDLEENLLLRNNGDGTFSNHTREAGLIGEGWSGDVAIFDFDEDGDLDIFVTNMFGLSHLYANDGQGHFQDVTRETLLVTSYGAIGCKAFDYDNDGRLDLFVADMHSDMWMEFDEESLIEPRRKYRFLLGNKVELNRQLLGEEAKWVTRLGIDYRLMRFGNTLFHQEGNGRFAEVSDEAGMETFWPWGVAVGDFDNDGEEDVFLPSGMGYPFFYHPSYLMMNRGDGTFVDAAAAEGIEPPREGRFLPEKIGGKPAARSSRCAATADFDGDGRLDLVVNNFNDRPYLYVNQFPQQNFVQFRLVGTRSNRDAIGALVKLHWGDRVMVRQVQAAGGYLSQSSKTLHFGLGKQDRIERIEIRWPSGIEQTLESPPINTLTEIREPDRPLP